MSNLLASDYVWGIRNENAFKRIEHFEADVPKTLPIRKALSIFLTSQIRRWQPDLIVVIERKGTAVLRSLMEGDSPIQWSWEHVISSKALEEILPDHLLGKRILVFDDMMKRGVHVKELLEDLRTLGVDVASQVRVAVFAIHEESSRGKELDGTIIPHAWYRCGLNTADYTSIRTEIVEMLQQSGSLMLDTEHLEVRVKLTGSFDRFVRALRRTGRASVFTSASSRVNITVLYDDDDIHRLPKEDFPEGTKIENIVKKCRVVQRSGNEFALIPICFPAIPAGQIWHCSRDIQMLLGDSVVEPRATDLSRFYGVGLRAALRVLRWVLRDLYAAAPNEFTISLPANVDDVRPGSGYHLGHLRVMYPTLDIDYLNKWIAKIECEAQSEGQHLPQREPLPSPLLTDDELHEKAVGLLQHIMDELDRKRILHYWPLSQHLNPHPFGLTAGEVFDIGNRQRWEKVLSSTLFDVLIDEATLVTHVQTISNSHGEKTVERTFEPDGEVVSEAVRRYTMQWGLPDANS
jgi:hypothetical protein